MGEYDSKYVPPALQKESLRRHVQGNMTVNMYRLTDMSASYVPINVFKAAHEAWREGKNYVVFFPKDSYAEYFMPISRAVKDWRMLMNKDCIYCDKEHVLKIISKMMRGMN